MRVLVTGASGFVGRRLLTRLAARAGAEPCGLSRTPPPAALLPPERWRSADLLDAAAVRAAVEELIPDAVVHLAAMAHPGDCARDPEGALRVARDGTRGLLEALPPGARVVLASSAQVYGPPPGRPLREEDPVAPTTPYGRSKAAAEEVARGAAERGREVVIARPFNHSGAGQDTRYVIPALCAAVARAKATGAPVRHGNLFPRRDFLHVEDVLDAYELLLEEGVAGEAYNVASGRGAAIGEVLDLLEWVACAKVERREDPELIRGDDPPEVVGDPARLRALGWTPRRSLLDLLREVWAERARAES